VLHRTPRPSRRAAWWDACGGGLPPGSIAEREREMRWAAAGGSVEESGSRGGGSEGGGWVTRI
jgi:hypothetical protein